MEHITRLILLITIYICLVSANVNYDCFVTNEQQECRFGSKTPYRFVANYNDSRLIYPGCTEKKIWLIFRHGTRYPSKSQIKAMKNDLPKLQKLLIKKHKSNQTSLTDDEIKRLKKWKPEFKKGIAKLLAEEGEDEMTDLAERMQSRFPSLFPEQYSNETYKFKYSNTQRTKESAKAFVLGLFGRNGSKKVQFPPPEDEDLILRFYKRCEKWKTEIKENLATREEVEKFTKSKIFNDTLEEISKRIGIDVDYVTAKTIRLMCVFETAWKKETSPWCSIFLPHQFQVFEYAEDLKYFWVDGYGYNLTYEQACPALQDAFSFIENPDEKPTVTAYFTHSGTILKLAALLGIGKDDKPLTFDSYSTHISDRNWRVGRIGPFASNLALVSFSCEDQGPSVLLMHQERAVQIPGCPLEKPCPLSMMKELYPDSEEECQFDEMCALKNE